MGDKEDELNNIDVNIDDNQLIEYTNNDIINNILNDIGRKKIDVKAYILDVEKYYLKNNKLSSNITDLYNKQLEEIIKEIKQELKYNKNFNFRKFLNKKLKLTNDNIKKNKVTLKLLVSPETYDKKNNYYEEYDDDYDYEDEETEETEKIYK